MLCHLMQRANSLEDPDAGKDWRQEEKRATKDETVGWHHWFNGHELGQTPGDGDRQRCLVCCSPWGCKESDMTWQLKNDNRAGKTRVHHFKLERGVKSNSLSLTFTSCSARFCHTIFTAGQGGRTQRSRGGACEKQRKLPFLSEGVLEMA